VKDFLSHIFGTRKFEEKRVVDLSDIYLLIVVNELDFYVVVSFIVIYYVFILSTFCTKHKQICDFYIYTSNNCSATLL